MKRRSFFGGAATMTALAEASGSKVALAALPEAASQDKPDTAPPPQPPNGRPYRPVVTLNGWSLPWRMRDGVKEFHLVAEPVERELAPGMTARLWGYNGQSPVPTIEVVEGDRVRIFVTNRPPEHTAVHWHGQRLPNGMDGVAGITQPHIQPGKTFVYEFEAKRPGTFMYHPHADEMVQMAMGMMGLWITHPRTAHPLIEPVDRLLLPAGRLRHRPGQRHAAREHHAGLQPVDLQHAGVPRHAHCPCARATRCAHPRGQPDHDQSSHPHPRPRVHGDWHRWRSGGARRAGRR